VSRQLARLIKAKCLAINPSQIKGYPFEVALVGVERVSGVVLADQVHSFDWEACQAQKAGRVADDVLLDVLAKIKVLLVVR
jgi:mRNA interferase MazF